MTQAPDPAVLLPEVAPPEVLQRQHRAHQLRIGAVLVLVSVGAAAALLLTFDRAWLARHWPQVGLAALLPVLPFFGFFRGLLQRQRIPIARAEPEHLGGYSRDELQQLFAEVRGLFPGRETPALYLVPDAFAEAPASTINALLLGNLLRPLNAVYLSPGLLHLLRRDELRAVLAHELAHFYGVMSLHGRTIGLVAAVLAASSAALVQGFALSNWWAVAGVGFGVRLLGVFALNQVGRKVDHLQEFLADQEAARRVGHVPMINALLRLELRDELMTEILFRVVRAVEQQPGLDLVALMKELARRVPQHTVCYSEVEPLLDELLAEQKEAAAASAGEIDEEMRQAMLQTLRELRTAYLKKKAYKKIAWEAFDTIVPDGQLDEQEMRGYLEALARDPEAVIAHSEAELGLGGEDTTHPRTRRRILFLAREFVFRAPEGGK